VYKFVQWSPIDIPHAVKRVIQVLDDHVEKMNSHGESDEHEHVCKGTSNAEENERTYKHD
jgi:hypothetical protein